jgi:ribonucleoside-diphosphate reductase alpha chain
MVYATSWCEHKPSITIYPKDSEWLEVGSWVYKNFDIVSGVSFLPHSEHLYEQAPYQDITEEQYTTLVNKMPKDIDWSLLAKYEKTDRTVSSQSYACTADSCEIVDVT